MPRPEYPKLVGVGNGDFRPQHRAQLVIGFVVKLDRVLAEAGFKADLIAALKDAVAYCKTTYAAMTDARGGEMVKLMNMDFARLAVLAGNTAHDYEHYGNMATYMRIKGIVPPTSEKGAEPGQK